MPGLELHDLDQYGAVAGVVGGPELRLGEVVPVGAVAVELLEAGWRVVGEMLALDWFL